MKKEYKKPEIKIDLLDLKDIVTTSGSAIIGGDSIPGDDFTFDANEFFHLGKDLKF